MKTITLILFLTPEQVAMAEAVRIHFKLRPGDLPPDPATATQADVDAVQAIFNGLLTEESDTKH